MSFKREKLCLSLAHVPQSNDAVPPARKDVSSIRRNGDSIHRIQMPLESAEVPFRIIAARDAIRSAGAAKSIQIRRTHPCDWDLTRQPAVVNVRWVTAVNGIVVLEGCPAISINQRMKMSGTDRFVDGSTSHVKIS